MLSPTRGPGRGGASLPRVPDGLAQSGGGRGTGDSAPLLAEPLPPGQRGAVRHPPPPRGGGRLIPVIPRPGHGPTGRDRQVSRPMAGGGAGPAPDRRCPKRAGRAAPLVVPARSVPSVRMAARGAGPWLLLLAAALALCAAAEPRCPSCAAGAERRLLEEAAKRQLLEKLRLRERPRLAHAVPRAAVARALRRLQAGGARRGPDDDEQGYEIISFAEPGGCAGPAGSQARPLAVAHAAPEGRSSRRARSHPVPDCGRPWASPYPAGPWAGGHL